MVPVFQATPDPRPPMVPTRSMGRRDRATYMRGIRDAKAEHERIVGESNRRASRQALADTASEHATPVAARQDAKPPVQSMIMSRLAAVDWGSAIGALSQYASTRRAQATPQPGPEMVDVPEGPPAAAGVPWGHLAAAGAAVLIFLLARRT